MERHNITWRAIGIEITFTLQKFGMADHIELRTGGKAALPVTETGYRSHFTSKVAVESYGGPLDFAKAWIEDEAASPEWQAHQAAHRQMSLF